MDERNESQKTPTKPGTLPNEGNRPRAVQKSKSKEKEVMIKLSQGFPVKLHCMLSEIEKDGLEHIVSWQPHGRCFMVHSRQQFVARILNCWFSQTSFESFQRQLNLYGFKRLSSGLDKGAYYHAEFLRHQPIQAGLIKRCKLKGTGPRKASKPGAEPNFYSMPFLTKDMETLETFKKLNTKQRCSESNRHVSSLLYIPSPHSNFPQSKIYKKTSVASPSDLLNMSRQSPQCILQPDLSYMTSFLPKEESNTNQCQHNYSDSYSDTKPVQPRTMVGLNTVLTDQASYHTSDASLDIGAICDNLANSPDDADDNRAGGGIYDDLF